MWSMRRSWRRRSVSSPGHGYIRGHRTRTSSSCGCPTTADSLNKAALALAEEEKVWFAYGFTDRPPTGMSVCGDHRCRTRARMDRRRGRPYRGKPGIPGRLTVSVHPWSVLGRCQTPSRVVAGPTSRAGGVHSGSNPLRVPGHGHGVTDGCSAAVVVEVDVDLVGARGTHAPGAPATSRWLGRRSSSAVAPARRASAGSRNRRYARAG